MVSVVASCGFKPNGSNKIGVCCFSALRSKSKDCFWLGIRIMCLSEPTCLPYDCCLSELALKYSNSMSWSRSKQTLSNRNVTCSCHELKKCSLGF